MQQNVSLAKVEIPPLATIQKYRVLDDAANNR